MKAWKPQSRMLVNFRSSGHLPHENMCFHNPQNDCRTPSFDQMMISQYCGDAGQVFSLTESEHLGSIAVTHSMGWAMASLCLTVDHGSFSRLLLVYREEPR